MMKVEEKWEIDDWELRDKKKLSMMMMLWDVYTPMRYGQCQFYSTQKLIQSSNLNIVSPSTYTPLLQLKLSYFIIYSLQSTLFFHWFSLEWKILIVMKAWNISILFENSIEMLLLRMKCHDITRTPVLFIHPSTRWSIKPWINPQILSLRQLQVWPPGLVQVQY